MRSILGNCVISLPILIAISSADPLLTIDQGTLRGIDIITSNGRNVSGFLGIPYGEPPIGDLRFRSPRPASSWTGVYNATKDRPACMQIMLPDVEITGKEDCLYANVFTPKLANDENLTPLPVMVWIHGGSFMQGSIHREFYGPKYLLNHDVVLVALAYRLGVFGFLSTADLEAPGNFGMKDLVLGLRWVRNNVRHFGGDPESVTVFGQSAGGVATHLLTFSEQTEGLFHRFILQSGIGTAPWGYRDSSLIRMNSIQVGESLGCPTSSTMALLACLREREASSIINASSVFTMAFIPTNEPEHDEAFMTDSPSNLMELGRMKDLPSISGTNRDEGLLITAGFYFWDGMNATIVLNGLKDQMKNILISSWTESQIIHISEAIDDYYFNDMSVEKKVFLDNLTTAISDMMFHYPALDLARKQVTRGSASAFKYSFEYRGTLSYSYNSTNKTDIGVSHSDELIYLFPLVESTLEKLNESMSTEDMAMVDKMTTMWTTFATTGVPNMTCCDKWKAFSEDENYLQIGNNSDTTLSMRRSLNDERMQFWSELLANHLDSSSTQSVSSWQLLVITILTYSIVRCISNW